MDDQVLVQQFVKEADGQDLRCLVVGGKVVAALQRRSGFDLNNAGSGRTEAWPPA